MLTLVVFRTGLPGGLNLAIEGELLQLSSKALTIIPLIDSSSAHSQFWSHQQILVPTEAGLRQLHPGHVLGHLGGAADGPVGLGHVLVVVRLLAVVLLPRHYRAGLQSEW